MRSSNLSKKESFGAARVAMVRPLIRQWTRLRVARAGEISRYASSISVVNQASKPLRSQSWPGHRKTFFTVCIEMVAAPSRRPCPL